MQHRNDKKIKGKQQQQQEKKRKERRSSCETHSTQIDTEFVLPTCFDFGIINDNVLFILRSCMCGRVHVWERGIRVCVCVWAHLTTGVFSYVSAFGRTDKMNEPKQFVNYSLANQFRQTEAEHYPGFAMSDSIATDSYLAIV